MRVSLSVGNIDVVCLPLTTIYAILVTLKIMNSLYLTVTIKKPNTEVMLQATGQYLNCAMQTST